jgi:hypothetical protein
MTSTVRELVNGEWVVTLPLPQNYTKFVPVLPLRKVR